MKWRDDRPPSRAEVNVVADAIRSASRAKSGPEGFTELDRLRTEVQSRREAMAAIYWVNTDPAIDAICVDVYERFREQPPGKPG